MNRKLRGNLYLLKNEDIEKIHEISLKILEEIGVYYGYKEALELFEAAGANVDRDKSVVKIPASVINNFLTLQNVVNDDLSDNCKTNPLEARMSTQVFYVDYNSMERRYGQYDDILKGIAVSNHLKNIKKISSLVVPFNIPSQMREIISHQLLYYYSQKPADTYITNIDSLDYVIEMANIMEQDIVYSFESISPLRFDAKHLEIAMKLISKGFRVGVGATVTAGSTGPVTIAGTIAQQNAEIIAGLIFLKLAGQNKEPGYSGGAFTVDIKTGNCSFGSPTQALLAIGQIQMARHYGLDCGCQVGLSDSIFPDFQCGFEKAFSVSIALMAGTYGIGAQGLVGADQGASLEQLVIDNEWIDYINYILQGIDINNDTLGFDVIKQTGIGGTFLSEMHTINHMRTELWNSDIFSKNGWMEASDNKFKSTLDRASKKVKLLLQKYYPPKRVIDVNKKRGIEKIVKSARKNFLK